MQLAKLPTFYIKIFRETFLKVQLMQFDAKMLSFVARNFHLDEFRFPFPCSEIATITNSSNSTKEWYNDWNKMKIKEPRKRWNKIQTWRIRSCHFEVVSLWFRSDSWVGHSSNQSTWIVPFWTLWHLKSTYNLNRPLIRNTPLN